MGDAHIFIRSTDSEKTIELFNGIVSDNYNRDKPGYYDTVDGVNKSHIHDQIITKMTMSSTFNIEFINDKAEPGSADFDLRDKSFKPHSFIKNSFGRTINTDEKVIPTNTSAEISIYIVGDEVEFGKYIWMLVESLGYEDHFHITVTKNTGAEAYTFTDHELGLRKVF